MPLGGSQVLVVVISRGNQITQKVIEGDERLTHDDLVQAANYLNTEFGGLPLDQVRASVQTRLRQERTLYDQLLGRALRGVGARRSTSSRRSRPSTSKARPPCSTARHRIASRWRRCGRSWR